MKKPKIFLDAGHGGKDPGGGTNQYWKEKDFALKITQYQSEEFKKRGFDVELTRNIDKYVGPTERADKVKTSGAELCISNHINAGGGEGFEVIHSINNNGNFARKIYEAVILKGHKGRRVFSKKNSHNKDWYYMHRNTGNVETYIIEYGFADNANDTQRLLKHWRNYADAVVETVCARYNVEYTKISWEENELNKAVENGYITNPKMWLSKFDEKATIKDVIGLVCGTLNKQKK